MARHPPGRVRAADLLTEVMLSVFHVNGSLLRAGDQLVAPLGLTSARWQMLGAVALSDRPRTAPRLADAMGVTRQGAQKQLDLLVSIGLMERQPNPGHARSPYYALTARGQAAYEAADRLRARWAARLAAGLALRELQATERVLSALGEALVGSAAEIAR